MTTTAPTTFPVGAEVTVAVTGRVVSHGPHGGLVLEYLRGNGFATREVFDTHSAAVVVQPAAEPSTDELRARERAARMLATAGRYPEHPTVPGELEQWQSAQQAWVDRFNDAYPVGTPVQYGDGPVSRTRGAARLLFDRTAVAWVDGEAGPVALAAVKPIVDGAA